MRKSVTLLFWVLSGCGVSPILHHQSAVPPNSNTPNHLDSTAPAIPCPISFSGAGLCADLTWDQTPSTHGANSFTVRFWSSADLANPVTYIDPPHRITARIWMPSMAHGSSAIVVTHLLQENMQTPVPGVYLGSRVYFAMPGDWDLHLELRSDEKVVEDAILSIHI